MGWQLIVTLGTPHAYDLASPPLRDLMTQYWEKAVQILAVLIVIGKSETVKADLITLSSSVREGSPDHPHRDVLSVVNAFCLHVKLSPCLSLFAASPNRATSRPGHGVFACLLIASEGLGDKSPWKMSALGPDCSMKISANFIHFYPLKKSYFCSVWPGPLSRGLPFEHSSSKMSTLDIELVYWTLCPSITSTHSTSKFCFNTFQYSVGGAVMPDAITYGEDCTVLPDYCKSWLTL